MRLALLLALAGTASAGNDRASYVAGALDAVHALGAQRTQLEADLYQACRQAGACSDAIVEARCHRDATCTAAADVIVTNWRAATSWVDQNTRAQLVRASTDYHAALAVELRKRYAALAAELVIGANGTAASIDHLCATRDREVHACTAGDPACVPSLPWTRCVAALVWFIGDSP